MLLKADLVLIVERKKKRSSANYEMIDAGRKGDI
jgi:hypothetical protein